MLTRRTVLTAVGAAAGGVGFMLALGWWRRPAPGLLPVPLSEMDFTLIDQRGTLATPQG